MPESFLSELWEAAKLAGPFGTLLMVFVWWRTDAERRKLLDERNVLLERVLEAINAVKEAVKENTKAILFLDRERRP